MWGQVFVQEVIEWGGEGNRLDCLTTFGRAGGRRIEAPVFLVNDHFMQEAALIRMYQSPYSRLASWQGLRRVTGVPKSDSP